MFPIMAAVIKRLRGDNMGILAFVGNREAGFFTEQIAARFSCEVEYVQSNGHIEQQVNDILYIPQLKYIVYDIQQYIDDPETIRDEIVKIQNCNNAKPIIYAPGYLMSSKIIITLYDFGFTEFILATDLADQRDQLEKCINGYYEENGISELESFRSLEEQEEQLKSEIKYTTIGIVGTQPRIGTTTQALHIIKYLIANGYKACYIHINDTNYIQELQEWWGADQVDEFLGQITYEGIDHFYKIEHLTEIKKLGYDFYVYDYGALTSRFNRESFLEKDIKIYVLGWKPLEMRATYKLLQSSIYIEGKYILSFGDELPEEDIEGIMGERMADTAIPKRCTEPYKLFDPHAYDSILQIQSKITDEKQNPKKFFGLFGGKKNGKV